MVTVLCSCLGIAAMNSAIHDSLCHDGVGLTNSGAPGENSDFDLYSLGADGAEGGEGESRDVTNWE